MGGAPCAIFAWISRIPTPETSLVGEDFLEGNGRNSIHGVPGGRQVGKNGAIEKISDGLTWASHLLQCMDNSNRGDPLAHAGGIKAVVDRESLGRGAAGGAFFPGCPGP